MYVKNQTAKKKKNLSFCLKIKVFVNLQIMSPLNFESEFLCETILRRKPSLYLGSIGSLCSIIHFHHFL